MEKQCIACGMPMKSNADYAIGDSSKDYCKFCCREDGSMQTYEEKLESMTNFITKSKNMAFDSAQSLAKSMMKKLPAWSDIK